MHYSFLPIEKRYLGRLGALLRDSIEDTCRRNQIVDRSIVDYEIEDKLARLEESQKTPTGYNSMSCVLIEGQPVAIGGSFECGKDILVNCSEAESTDIEIGSIYVAPNFQGLGVGRFIYHALKEQLSAKGTDRFFLDSGYRTSQDYWRKQLGKPYIDVPSTFGSGFRYQIWMIRL